MDHFTRIEKSVRAGDACFRLYELEKARKLAMEIREKGVRKAKAKDGHHVIQEAAVRDIPGYNSIDAFAVQLEGPSHLAGTPHNATRTVQRQAGGGTYAAERRIGYKSLRRAGVPEDEARDLMNQADKYFESIGVSPDTPTRIPGDRR